jgi:hypothetical protein
MKTNILSFPAPQNLHAPIASYIRVGETHRLIHNAIAQNRLRARRFVFEASRLTRQKDVIEAIKADGGECVLDSCAAELSARNKFQTQVRMAEWLNEVPVNPLGPGAFTDEVLMNLAQLAMTYSFDAILCPAHYLDDKDYSWLEDDLKICTRLRAALDAVGGNHISIDYPLIMNHTTLAASQRMEKVLLGISELPVENIWLRLSGMSRDLGPQKTRRVIKAMHGFQNLGKPIILDYAGGLAGLAPAAFGVSSGFCTGIMSQDQFNAREWHKSPKPRSEDDDFKRTKYIQVPTLGRNVSSKEFTLLAETRGGKRLLLDPSFTNIRDVNEMKRRYKEIAADTLSKSVESLRGVPNAKRAEHFVSTQIEPAIKRAYAIAQLNPNAEKATELGVDVTRLKARIRNHGDNLVKSGEALNKLIDEYAGETPRSAVAQFRGSNKQVSKKGVQR